MNDIKKLNIKSIDYHQLMENDKITLKFDSNKNSRDFEDAENVKEGERINLCLIDYDRAMMRRWNRNDGSYYLGCTIDEFRQERVYSEITNIEKIENEDVIEIYISLVKLNGRFDIDGEFCEY